MVTLGVGAAGNHAEGTRSIDNFLELECLEVPVCSCYYNTS